MSRAEVAHALRSLACLALVAACNPILGIDEPNADVFAADSNINRSDAGDDEDAGEPHDGGAPTPLYSHAVWPMPNPASTGLSNPQSYEIADDVVIDRVTQLQWQRVASGTSMTWLAAKDACTSLQVAGGGFRLPSRIELLSLVDFAASTAAAIDGPAFPDAPADGFWSASLTHVTTSSAWGVNFGFSTSIVFQDDVHRPHRVRCVRSASVERERRDLIAANGIVEDMATQLHWQQQSTPEPTTWTGAKTQCAELDLEGDGWRLPTIKELHTLIDETRDQPATDSAMFPGPTIGYYWTSSQPRGFGNLAWTAGFDHGLDVFRSVDGDAFVRCVR